MNPILLDLPTTIKTPRLLIRPFMPGDSKVLNTAIVESFDQLHQWMEWAREKPTVEQTEEICRTSYADWTLRKGMNMLLLDPTQKIVIGASGFNNLNWDESSFAIGYWVRTSYQGQGFITEAVNALTRYAFKYLGALRVEIRCDEDNVRSRKIAERLNFKLEGTLKASVPRPSDNSLIDTVIYVRYDVQGLPDLEIAVE